MVDMRSTQLLKTSDIFEVQHSTRSVYLERTTIVRLLPNEGTFHKDNFHIDKRIHFIVNTKSKNTKTIMCSSWSKRNSSPSNLLFPEITLISLLTNQNLITVDSRKEPNKTIHSVISNVRTRTKHHQMQMLILNRLRLKLDFSQTLSLQPNLNDDVFKGKVFKQKTRQYNELEKSSRKF